MTGLVVLALVIVLASLWGSVRTLRQRLDQLERELDRRTDPDRDGQLRALRDRVAELEGAGQGPPGPAPATSVEPARPPAGPPAPEPSEPFAPAEPEPVPELVVPPPAPPPAEPPSEPTVATPVASELPPAGSLPSPPPEAAATAAGWELTVGSDWFNKLGVLVFVVGLALLVSYSFTRVGPAGRVAIGYAASAALLGAGHVLEQRRRYRRYGYGLVAGGWAGVYFTTYALHGIDAARLIESELTGAVLLAVVAAAMIGHTLRYQSQTVTVLAFVVGYVTLAIAPLSWFALFAAVPLATAVLVVAQRYRWHGVSALGVAATYALFALRDAGVGGQPPDAATVAPYVLLATYWALFEGADLVGLRASRVDGRHAQPLFALNAVGLVGCTLLAQPAGGLAFLPVYLAALGAGYAGSAALRRRWLSAGPVGDDRAPREPTTFHFAVAMTAGLVMWSAGSRFDGARLAATWLVEAELVVALGFFLVDPIVRRIGGAAFVVTVGFGLLAAADDTRLIGSMAAAAYANREWLRARDEAGAGVERGYGWLGFALVAVVLLHEFSWTTRGLAFIVAATVLIEAGLRRAAEYRHQAYAALGIGGWLLLFAFTNAAFTSTRDAWQALPAAVALAWLGAFRLTRHADDLDDDERGVAPGAVSSLGTLLLVVFEGRVVADAWLAPVWGATGLALLAAGLARSVGALRWQGYALMLVAAAPAVWPILTQDPVGSTATTAALVTAALLYGAAGMRAWLGRTTSLAEGWAVSVLSSAGVALVTTLEWRVVPEAWSGLVIVATGVLHLGSTAMSGSAVQRWQGYALLWLGLVRAFGPVLGPLPMPPAELAAFLNALALSYGAVVAIVWTRRVRHSELEIGALGVVFVTTTAMLAAFEWRVLPQAWAGPALGATALVLFTGGVIGPLTVLRVLGHALFTLGVLRAADPLFAPRGAPLADSLALVGVIACLYAGSAIGRQGLRQAAWAVERAAPRVLLVAATGLLTWLVGAQLQPSLVTAAWGLMGLLLLVAGFPMRERLVRLTGLALFALCILKLFTYDLRELEALARIFSFVLLGAVLLAVSWAYTRFGDQIRKYL